MVYPADISFSAWWLLFSGKNVYTLITIKTAQNIVESATASFFIKYNLTLYSMIGGFAEIIQKSHT
ncbi:MAG: hypothetical protein IKT63_05225 [Oscillospiraceae bacterium]|nr:hypothetical protein [Oscillospiraceae bacterium]